MNSGSYSWTVSLFAVREATFYDLENSQGKGELYEKFNSDNKSQHRGSTGNER